MQAWEDIEHSLRYFAVWALNPLGECECGRGTTSGYDDDKMRHAEKGPCTSVGKHPWAGFPHGQKDAMGYAEYQQAWPTIQERGGRTAVALPDWLWVLDVDSEAGWRNLLALILNGAIPADRVARVARTRRGWHVYYLPPWAGGWSSGAAQKDVNQILKMLGRKPEGLDLKTKGGYVVWPDGKERDWVEPRVFQQEVAFGLGPGMRGRPRLEVVVPVAGASEPVREYAGSSGDGGASASAAKESLAAMAEYVTGDQLQRWQEQAMAAMKIQMGQVPEGSRNVALNRCAYIEGRECLRVGVPAAVVRGHLENWGNSLGLEPGEVRSTVRSGLGLGS